MPAVVPRLKHRIHVGEWLDERDIDEIEVARALRELQKVNVFLGGYRALASCLLPFFRERIGGAVAILDLGAGLADYPERMVRWGAKLGVDVRVTAVDVNSAMLHQAVRYLDSALGDGLRDRVQLVRADARDLPFENGAFAVVSCSHFLHHFDDAHAIQLLREMDRLATSGVIVNDLHRHPLAYLGFRAIATALPVSDVFAHDGAASIRRAFRPDELRELAAQANLRGAVVRRHWAYRLTLSTI